MHSLARSLFIIRFLLQDLRYFSVLLPESSVFLLLPRPFCCAYYFYYIRSILIYYISIFLQSHIQGADWTVDSLRVTATDLHFPPPSTPVSAATAPRDAADGQPAFRHHQRGLGDGRGAARPDWRKRQGEQRRGYFFFFVCFLSQSHQPTPEMCLFAGLTGASVHHWGGVTTHHLGRRSRSRDDKYSLNHLLYVTLADPGSFRSLCRLSDVV